MSGDCAEPGDCQEALDKLQEYLDGEVPETRLGEIRDHLSACYPCGDRASFEEQLRAIVRRECADRAPEALIERIRIRLADGAATAS